MSSIGKYLKLKGKDVYGYDREESDMTKSLEKVGVKISYDDSCYLKNKKLTSSNILIIYSIFIKIRFKLLTTTNL